MNWQEAELASVPAIALAITIVVHIGIARLRPERSPWWSLSIAAAAGVLFAAVSTVYLLRSASFLELSAYIITNVSGAAAFAFGYFCFVTLNYTSLRVRMVRELASRNDGFSIDDLKSRYSGDVALDLRLARLVKAGELRFDGNFYYLGSSRRFLWIGRMWQFLRMILGDCPSKL